MCFVPRILTAPYKNRILFLTLDSSIYEKNKYLKAFTCTKVSALNLKISTYLHNLDNKKNKTKKP